MVKLIGFECEDTADDFCCTALSDATAEARVISCLVPADEEIWCCALYQTCAVGNISTALK